MKKIVLTIKDLDTCIEALQFHKSLIMYQHPKIDRVLKKLHAIQEIIYEQKIRQQDVNNK